MLQPVGIIKPADCNGCALLYEGESSYNYIQVATRPGNGGDDIYLILNEGKAIHSVYRTAFARSGDPRDLLTNGPWDYFNVAPYFYPNRDPESITSLALIGSAAGTVPKQFLTLYGADSRIDSVEIDPQIVDIGRRFFAMEDQDPRFPNYRTHVQDGRVFIELTDQKYDVIGMDAYRQPYIPFHLTTRQFFETVRAHLTPDGVAVVNAGKPGTDYRLVEVLASTMKAVFPQVFLIDVPSYGNTIIVGVNRPVGDGVANFVANYQRIQDPTLRHIMATALASDERKLPVREWTGEGPVFTDDWAPVEWVIDQIIIEQVEQVQ
ncbi:MAG: hypothetical protein KatS3mg057_2554 [Herpetosiphonaceae bacterium]|nr:MAG: hypothetical protein KatS3mg057_2554 [Herpetosiphonaceae bacterium]